MEIIDKIVKSVSEPKQKNVLWLNPTTKNRLIYTSKGWIKI